MALDWPAFGDALWKVSDQLGIRPEWQLPVLYLETAGTFDPAIMNPDGCVGLNQFCQAPGTYKRYVSVPVSEYQTWTASQQLAGPILNYWRDALQYGSIRSSARLMLSQLGQVLLKTAPSLDSVVFRSPSQEYKSNSSFDASNKHYITVRDLANSMAGRARTAAVQNAIAQAYAMRPGEKPRDPVYGDDYVDFSRVTPPASPPNGAPVAVLGVALLAVIAAVAADEARARFA